MTVLRGYRSGLSEPRDLADFLASLRGSSLRVFGRRYGVLLADEVARRIDLHRAGVEPREPDASPLRESVEQMRASYPSGGKAASEAGLDLRLRLFPLESDLLVRVEAAHADYLEGLAAMEGVSDASLPATGRPDDVPAEAYAAREALWERALAGPPLGLGLTFSLVDEALPSLRLPALRRHFPMHEARVRRTARASLFHRRTGLAVPEDATQAREYRRFLDTGKGRALLEDEVRRLGRVLPPSLDRDEVSRYAAKAAQAAARAAPAPAAPMPDESPVPSTTPT